MGEIAQAFGTAFGLIAGFDRHLVGIVGLSLAVSLSAVVLATLLGLPLGAAVALGRFPGRQGAIAVLNGFMGLPPVVVGLFVYLMLSRAGPLGPLGLLFTPGAMVIAQAILILPIIAALARQTIEDAWHDYEEQLRSLGAGPRRAMWTLLWDTRFSLFTAVLAGFGRASAEVGAVMIVGGNIDGVTRVMTTTIALETSKGDLPLALGLGVILITLVIVLNASAYAVKETAQRRYG
jgi:tungstate transport system permease protein